MGLADANGVVGQFHGKRIPIGFREDDHRLNAEFAAGPDNPNGDLSSIGD